MSIEGENEPSLLRALVVHRWCAGDPVAAQAFGCESSSLTMAGSDATLSALDLDTSTAAEFALLHELGDLLPRLRAAFSIEDQLSLDALLRQHVPLHEVVGALHKRRRDGRFYTPDMLAARLVEGVVEAHCEDVDLQDANILDPACGAGSLLLASAKRQRNAGMSSRAALARIFGTDVDPVAVELARLRIVEELGPTPELLHLATENIRTRDALHRPPPCRAADIILLNPPYRGAIKGDTARDDVERAALRRCFPLSTVGAYDMTGPFVERAMQIASPGATLGLLLPQAFLAARSTEKLRRESSRSHRLSSLYFDERMDWFTGADVRVCGLVLQSNVAERNGGDSSFRIPVRRDDDEDRWRTSPRSGAQVRDEAEEPCDSVRLASGLVRLRSWRDRASEPTRYAPQPPLSRWGRLLSPLADLSDFPDAWPELGTCFRIGACAATGEAYDLLPHVEDDEHGDGLPLLTSGSIDPHEMHWGSRTTRYLKRTYRHPRVARGAFSEKRLEQHLSRKVLIPGLSRVLEAVLDERGALAGAVAVVSLRGLTADERAARATHPAPPLSRIALWLNSMPIRAWYRREHGGLQLGGGSVQVHRAKIAELAWPPALAGEAVAAPPWKDDTHFRLVSTREMPTRERLVEIERAANTLRSWSNAALRGALDDAFELTDVLLRQSRAEPLLYEISRRDGCTWTA